MPAPHRLLRPVAALAAGALLVAIQGPAEAITYAPIHRPGPALSIPAAALARSLTCSSNLRTSTREATLLIPGTTLTAAQNYSWNYERAFNAQKRPWCAVRLPDSAMGEIQAAGEYVVHAIRRMHQLTHRKIQIVGYSQGGMLPRWALRFWPDTRAMVDDVIGIAPSNHGTLDAIALCNQVVGCAPALWQQAQGSAFYGALNSGAETFAGISYTDICTVTDEVVVPNFNNAGSSSL
ncbi:MAG TPA: lipase, partial [Marmoricola sp.]|nr:lipase [Marmoricola sp.]